MKRTLRILLLVALAALMLTVSALADMGPKPLLTLRVENAPQEPYYLDILAEGVFPKKDYNGIIWNYDEEERAALDQDLLAALRDAVPEGWHACTAEGFDGAPTWGDLYAEAWAEDGAPLHSFGYVGLPQTYRVLIVTQSGDIWLSDPAERASLQCTATVDYAAGTVSEAQMLRNGKVVMKPVWQAYAVELLCTLIPTLIVEGILLALFGFAKSRRNWIVFFAVNLVTQLGVFLSLGVTAVQEGVGLGYFLLLIVVELVVVFAETAAFSHLLTGRTRARAAAYAITANLCSAVLGWFLAEPVWRLVVSIS